MADSDRRGRAAYAMEGRTIPACTRTAGDVSALKAAGLAVDHPIETEKTHGGIRTVPTPGHTPDNMAYCCADVLVAGDTVVAADSPFATTEDWSGPFAVIAADYNADDEQARASVSVLTESDFEIVLVSHGANVLENGRKPIETLIADLEQSVESKTNGDCWCFCTDDK